MLNDICPDVLIKRGLMIMACIPGGCSNHAGSMAIPTSVTAVSGVPVAGDEGSPEATGGTTTAIDVTAAPAQEAYADLPFTPTLFQSPPMPIICDGKMTFGAYATWTDPDTGRTVRGTISAEYDFDNDQPLGYRLIDLDNLE